MPVPEEQGTMFEAPKAHAQTALQRLMSDGRKAFWTGLLLGAVSAGVATWYWIKKRS